MGATYSIKVEFHKQRGESESTPITAGSILQGKVIIDLTSSLYLAQQQQAKQTTASGSANNNNSNSNNNTNDEIPNLSLLTLRIYGKEKVGMNLYNAKKRASAYGSRPMPAPAQSQAGNTININTSALATTPVQAELQYPKHTEIQFFDVTLPLSQFPLSSYDRKYNCIKPGLYKFPFQIQLPYELPSSTSYNPSTKLHHSYPNSIANNSNTSTSAIFTNLFTSKHSGFRIQYKFHVQLHSTTKGDNVHTPSQYLWVRSAPKTTIHSTPLPSMVLPVAHELQTKNTFWTQKGSLLIAASVEDSIISRSDDHINIHLACRNNSRADIQRIQLQLIEKICWGTVPTKGPSTNSAGTILQEENNLILMTLNDIVLPTLQKSSQTLVSSMAQSLLGTKNKTERDYLQSIHSDLISDQSTVSISLPLDQLARDSYSGQLAQVSHHIEIRFITTPSKASNNTALGHNPLIVIPVRLVNGQKHTIADLNGSFCASIEECQENNEKLHNDTVQYTPQLGIGSSTSFDIMDDENYTEGEEKKHDDNMELSNIVPIPAPNVQQPKDENNSNAIPIVTAMGNSNAILIGNDAATLSKLLPLAPPPGTGTGTPTVPVTVKPSLSKLLSDIRTSIDAYSTIQKYTNNNNINNDTATEAWIDFLSKLNPFEYGQVIAAVPDPFDQPRVAVLIGQHINDRRITEQVPSKGKVKKTTQTPPPPPSTSNTRNGLTCDYIAVAIRFVEENHRASIAQALLPIGTDVVANHTLILNELSVWDQTVISSTLESIIVNETMPSVPVGKGKVPGRPATTTTTNNVKQSSPNKILQPAYAN